MYFIKNRNRNNDLLGGNLFDDFFNLPLFKAEASVMKTDIKKEDDKYVFEIDVPGFNKEDIKISLNEGYLVIEASKEKNEEEKDKEGNYIRRERYFGKTSRSFYVGNITESDIEASYNDGVLTIKALDYEKNKDANKKFIEII